MLLPYYSVQCTYALDIPLSFTVDRCVHRALVNRRDLVKKYIEVEKLKITETWSNDNSSH